MAIHHVSLKFAQLSDAALGDFSNAVITRMDGNPAYPTPAVSLAALRAATDEFLADLVAAAQGGKLFTAKKNVSRVNLITLLRTQAAYVESAANNVLPVILSSGFEVTKTDRTRRPLVKPVITNIDNFASTQLMLRLHPVENARSYEVRTRVRDGEWRMAGVFTNSRAIPVDGLVPGTTYEVQTRAVGGSMGYSDWSDPVARMAT